MQPNSASFSTSDWPVLTRYDRDHLRRIALPLGGIGTGTISLGGRGNLHDFEVVNRPAKGFTPTNTFFAINIQKPDGTQITRVLEGAISPDDYEGAVGCALPNHSLPRFRECEFEAAYPFGQVLLSDPDVPVSIRLQAFNPLIACNSQDSSFPVAVLRYNLTNNSAENMNISVAGTLQNFIGNDGSTSAGATEKRNFNEFRVGENFQGVFGQTKNVDIHAEQWGTLALGVLGAENQTVSHRTSWAQLTWGDSLLDFWDDFSADGVLEERAAQDQTEPHLSLTSALELAPGETRDITFVLGWHFPNRMAWQGAAVAEASKEKDSTARNPETEIREMPARNANYIGNFYTEQFSDAWNVLEKFVPVLPALEQNSIAFVQAFCETDLPHDVREAALYNLSTLRTQTCFRTPDGLFFAWEGCYDKIGSCAGSCTHVWNYEQGMAFVFGDLARTMREVEFLHSVAENGLMSFRINLPLERKTEHLWLAAADGQNGCPMKLYRDWKNCGDDEWLRKLWPNAKKSIEFNWIPGGWDGDIDGVMEGCQHNTMDVEYFGPNPQMQAWYLGALRAGEEMAKYLGDDEFAKKCRELFEKGKNWTDENLFNGEYYEHEIRPIPNADDIAHGLRIGMGDGELSDPQLQLGAGCLIDQLVGQYMAHVCGLGYLLNEENVKTTLQSVVRFNKRDNFHGHFNHLRSYVLGDERAILMASYPRGRRPKRPFPYYNEVMTGFEHSLAAHLLFEGDRQDGLKIVSDIRARYDGKKRSPFDEAECGHHYGRALASWAHVLALTGFEYSGVTQTITFAADKENANWFWSNGNAWGTIAQIPTDGKIEVKLQVSGGVLRLQHVKLRGLGIHKFDEPRELAAGEEIEFSIAR